MMILDGEALLILAKGDGSEVNARGGILNATRRYFKRDSARHVATRTENH